MSQVKDWASLVLNSVSTSAHMSQAGIHMFLDSELAIRKTALFLISDLIGKMPSSNKVAATGIDLRTSINILRKASCAFCN